MLFSHSHSHIFQSFRFKNSTPICLLIIWGTWTPALLWFCVSRISERDTVNLQVKYAINKWALVKEITDSNLFCKLIFLGWSNSLICVSCLRAPWSSGCQTSRTEHPHFLQFGRQMLTCVAQSLHMDTVREDLHHTLQVFASAVTTCYIRHVSKCANQMVVQWTLCAQDQLSPKFCFAEQLAMQSWQQV